MKIGELAARAGCDVQTVRFYEREGLLEESAREPSGYRRYEKPHLTQLSLVRHLRSFDIPLPEVRLLLVHAAEPEASCTQVDSARRAHQLGAAARAGAPVAGEATRCPAQDLRWRCVQSLRDPAVLYVGCEGASVRDSIGDRLACRGMTWTLVRSSPTVTEAPGTRRR